MANRSDIKVSICCATYNHEEYISQALDGFLMQKTTFPFEVLIHDDASADSTTDIIRRYAAINPSIIKPIIQTENKYSQGIGIHTTYLWPNTQGKYIAQCEGDDYWTDPFKLQNQINYMESNNDCSLCVHAVSRISSTAGETLSPLQPANCNRIFTVEEVIRGGGGLFGTNSMLFRTKYINDFPEYYCDAPVGDYPLTIHLALQGKVFYINSIMAARRTNAPGSWTTLNSQDIQRIVRIREELIRMLHAIDAHTEYAYTNTIEEKIMDYQLRILLHLGRYGEACSRKFKMQLKNRFSLRQRIKLYLRAMFNLTFRTC